MNTPARDARRSFQEIKTRVLEQIWEIEPSEFVGVKRVLRTCLRVALMVGRDFIKNLVKLHAMALAFKTLLSLAPLLAVIFSLLKAFGVHNRMEPVLAEALAPLGEGGVEITAYLIGFVDRMKAGALGSVGLVTLFVTVMSLMGTIEEAFNHIWRVKAPRKLSRKFSDYLSVTLVGPVLVFAALTITATLQSHSFVRQFLAFEPFGTVLLGLLRLVPYLALWGAFAFFYIFVPNTRVKLKSALIGSLVAALLWQTVGWGFARFVAASTQYYAIYSSFAVLLLFLLWLHVGWLIVLLGAQVTHAHQSIRFYHRDRDHLANTLAGREKIALEILLLIGARFYGGLYPLTIDEIAARLEVPAGTVKDLMETFQNFGLVLALAGEESFVLSRHPETISIKEILDCVRKGRERRKSRRSVGKEESAVDELLLDVEQSVADTLEGKSLQSLILSVSPPVRP
ncbi:MAG TPA: YhjD/YihY/BrkB family envelope integrity protein [Candidatus Binatia bacterium]|jgi:membrane protein